MLVQKSIITAFCETIFYDFLAWLREPSARHGQLSPSLRVTVYACSFAHVPTVHPRSLSSPAQVMSLWEVHQLWAEAAIQHSVWDLARCPSPGISVRLL